MTDAKTKPLPFRVVTYADTYHIEDVDLKMYTPSEDFKSANTSCNRMNSMDMDIKLIRESFAWHQRPRPQTWQK